MPTLGFLFDRNSLSPVDDEAAVVLLELRAARVPVDKFYCQNATHNFGNIIRNPPDVLIMDYGGAALESDYSGAVSGMRWVLEWAAEHPQTLVVLWTRYTYMLYGEELEREFGHLPNVTARFKAGQSAFDFNPNHDRPVAEAIMAHVGLQEESDG